MVARRPDPEFNGSPDEGALRKSLAESKARVEELSARLDDLTAEGRRFLAEAAHTVRGALTITHSYLEILHTDLTEGLTEEQRTFVGIAYQNAEKLRQLVEDLVELASLETGAAQLDLTPVRVNETIEDLREELALSTADRGLVLTTELGPSIPEVNVDTRRLADVVRRLVANAARFTPHGGSVVVRTSFDSSAVLIVVEDNGVGIPATKLEDCMKAFGQGHRKPGEQRIGYGLGLPLCQRQVEAIGGTLELESTEGRGTTVTIRLPVLGCD